MTKLLPNPGNLVYLPSETLLLNKNSLRTKKLKEPANVLYIGSLSENMKHYKHIIFMNEQEWFIVDDIESLYVYNQ
tara:strand:+ start:809 stop:1036 length:228 start_codon:yes stop_codon:yes gene_type:complete